MEDNKNNDGGGHTAARRARTRRQAPARATADPAAPAATRARTPRAASSRPPPEAVPAPGPRPASPRSAPTPTPAPRVFEAICARIRSQLASGQLQPGDKLPAERDLAVLCGSSRTAVREALRSLEIAGVVELRKGVKGGAFILEGDPAVVTRSFGDMVHLGRISLESLTESRAILIDAVLRLACERGTEADFDALEQNIARTERLKQLRRGDERRRQLVHFYRLLAEATRNEVMVILVDALTDILLTVLERDRTRPRDASIAAHREIVQRLRARDADGAAARMSQHFRELHAHLFAAATRRRGARS